MQRKSLPELCLAFGLAFVFGVFGIEKFLRPALWIGWIPLKFEGLLGLTRDAWLKIAGVAEILLAILVIIPVRRVRKAGVLLMAFALAAIFTQVGWNDVGVRDLGLLAASVALWLLL